MTNKYHMITEMEDIPHTEFFEWLFKYFSINPDEITFKQIMDAIVATVGSLDIEITNNEELAGELAVMDEEVTRLTQRIDELEKEVEELQDERDDLDSEIEILRAELNY